MIRLTALAGLLTFLIFVFPLLASATAPSGSKAKLRVAIVKNDSEGPKTMADGGLLPLLEDLRGRGYRLGVASNSPWKHIVSTTRRLGIAGHFASMVGADQVARPKPAPDVYLHAARGLGLAPTACLAAEDSPSGVEAAYAAGMACVFIPNRDLPATNHVVAQAVYPSLTAWHADLDRLLPARPA